MKKFVGFNDQLEQDFLDVLALRIGKELSVDFEQLEGLKAIIYGEIENLTNMAAVPYHISQKIQGDSYSTDYEGYAEELKSLARKSTK